MNSSPAFAFFLCSMSRRRGSRPQRLRRGNVWGSVAKLKTVYQRGKAWPCLVEYHTRPSVRSPSSKYLMMAAAWFRFHLVFGSGAQYSKKENMCLYRNEADGIKE